MDTKSLDILAALQHDRKQLRERFTPQILEYKSHAPRVGCFWEYGYSYVTGTHIEPIHRPAVHDPYAIPDFIKAIEAGSWYWDSIALYLIGKDLSDNIPSEWWPKFSSFLGKQGKLFWWPCYHCGLTSSYPRRPCGSMGVGGMVSNTTDYHCDECVSKFRCGSCGDILDPDNAWWDHDAGLIAMYNVGYCPACSHRR